MNNERDEFWILNAQIPLGIIEPWNILAYDVIREWCNFIHCKRDKGPVKKKKIMLIMHAKTTERKVLITCIYKLALNHAAAHH